jgi:hypothetical protein
METLLAVPPTPDPETPLDQRAPGLDPSPPPRVIDFEQAKFSRDVERAMAAAIAARPDAAARARLARHGGLRLITGGLA